MEIPPFSLEDLLTKEEISDFHQRWKIFNDKYALSSPYEVHGALPVISKVFKIEGKNVFRARVFQKKKHLRSLNPYFNAPYYLHPFWHPHHYSTVVEQLYHASTEIIRPNNNIYNAKDIASQEIKKSVFWPAHNNGNVSVIGIYKLRKGSWNRGKATEQFKGIIVDDETGEEHYNMNAICFINFRSFYIAYENLKAGTPGARERMHRLISDQERKLSELNFQRQYLKSSAEELISCLSRGEIPDIESVVDFFSFYDKK